MKRLIRLDWDALAGIIAAIAAIVLHRLHIIDEETVLSAILLLIAILFVRGLRHEKQVEGVENTIARSDRTLSHLAQGLGMPDVQVVGPKDLQGMTRQFSERAIGGMVWFQVCLEMFRSQELFEAFLKPAIENQQVDSIQFISRKEQVPIWDSEIRPKIAKCEGGAKVREPKWIETSENISFIISDTEPNGETECLLSFWGEPFMSISQERNVPRYVFHLQRGSELIAPLSEIERRYRLST